MGVPLIDLSEGSSGQVASRVADACVRDGFFAITGHGVGPALIERMYEATKALFALPEPVKDALVVDPADPFGRGFSRSGAVAKASDEDSRLVRAEATAPPDLCEVFSMAVAAERDYAEVPHPDLMRPNHWPAFASDQEWIRETWLAYCAEMSQLSDRIMRLFAIALDLPETWFEKFIDQEIGSLTANYYPKQFAAPVPGQVRKGEHTDWGSLTLLYQDSAAGGLQVMELDGSWTDVPVVEGAFLVNLGDLMARWTNDRWRSTVHRVVNPPRTGEPTERFSIPYFHQPNYDALIECIPTCLGPGESPKYAPVTSGNHLLSKVSRMYATA
ncbi:isopenicillin N synthase family oxygenase [Actinomadura sp. WMMA1423]|uniref:isopenicillin N synthase family dioxygenase n=1 Tax=Actinomadura sp. WMMA1423 TaxID=2591108 RepID=UPI001146ED9E|nr:2OG-Fe(II) oxygenase family protein [Actinomadura sp. WMMA1423]